MCGVEAVAMSFGRGNASLVIAGRTTAVGTWFTDVGTLSTGVEGADSVESLLGEQADRIRLRKRSVRKIRCMLV